MATDPDPRVHFFICVNERPENAPLPSCAGRGGHALLESFQREFARRGYPRGVKVSGSTCLTTCQCGPTVAVYPQGVWYVGVSETDVEELFETHLSGNGMVERLRPPDDVTVW